MISQNKTEIKILFISLVLWQKGVPIKCSETTILIPWQSWELKKKKYFAIPVKRLKINDLLSKHHERSRIVEVIDQNGIYAYIVLALLNSFAKFLYISIPFCSTSSIPSAAFINLKKYIFLSSTKHSKS